MNRLGGAGVCSRRMVDDDKGDSVGSSGASGVFNGDGDRIVAEIGGTKSGGRAVGAGGERSS